jgi:ribose transport system permease protein
MQLDAKPFWQFISVGIVIIISVLIDQAQRSYGEGRKSE